MKKTAHIISHSHWDREWYMPFEYHRAYLIRLIDDCLELFEVDKEFKSFHLDGHTVLLEDYLEVKPQNREKIEKYVKEGRFAVGPWYVLQDEFLTSSEANIRNLLIGISMAKEFGKVTPIGYFPDTFGNAGQMPQILKQAGMKAIVFGRGVKPTGMNNTISDSYASQFSEMYWKSPDGSVLPAILFANWYNNGVEIPENGNKDYWDRVLFMTEKYASTGELLIMNGCDHQPVQKNLSNALKSASLNYPEYNFVHSTFENYTDALLQSIPNNLTTVSGELTGQDTDGWFTLVNTCSSHVDLKVLNRKCEIFLENVAEPLSVIAMQLGKKYPHELLVYSWKTLMKNHPHDSICGCSCDAVSEEMKIRFSKCRQATDMIVRDDLAYIAGCIDKSRFKNCEAVFAVVNTLSKARRNVVTLDVDVRRIYNYKDIRSAYSDIEKNIYNGCYEIVDAEGVPVPCTVKKRRARFGYDLPNDKFRQPYVAETITISFETSTISSMGYEVYGIRKTLNMFLSNELNQEGVLENEYIKACINFDGTITVFDKKTGRQFSNLMKFEDVGDIGSEYTFMPVLNDKPIYSGEKAEIELLQNEEYIKEYKVTVMMDIPKCCGEIAKSELSQGAYIKDRCGDRSEEMITIPINYYISLAKHSKRLDIRIEFVNSAKDHRLRVLFPTGLSCNRHKVESVFEVAERNNKHNECWTYPSGCEHQQGFVMMNDGNAGLAIANVGLYEYEIVDGNVIAITLVRAVGELGDWGIFPTELSQQQTTLELDLSIIPFLDDNTVLEETESFQCKMVSCQLLECGENSFENNNFIWHGDGIRMTTFKAAQESNDIIIRFVNFKDKESILQISKSQWINNLSLSNVLEEYGEELQESNGIWSITLKPFEIITLKCIRR